MKFQVSSSLEYDVKSFGTLILNIHAFKTPGQLVLEETLTVDPFFEAKEMVSSDGQHRLVCLEVNNETAIRISYSAIVETTFHITDHSADKELQVSQLPADYLQYLYPSRYCQSDKLFRLANNKFGKIENPFQQVIAVTEWITSHVEYLSGSTNSQTSAFDTVTEQVGVCRDFAHLAIALCRALNIPARYFSGYAYQLNPPDFHGCFEAYLNGFWVIFDSTKLVPLNGLVRIGTGRDAADTAISTIFGDVSCNAINVSCQCLEEKFEPFFYDASSMQGISYL
jgi:hypothetical protein